MPEPLIAHGIFQNADFFIIFLTNRSMKIIHKRLVPIPRYVETMYRFKKEYPNLCIRKFEEIDLQIFSPEFIEILKTAKVNMERLWEDK